MSEIKSGASFNCDIFIYRKKGEKDDRNQRSKSSRKNGSNKVLSDVTTINYEGEKPFGRFRSSGMLVTTLLEDVYHGSEPIRKIIVMRKKVKDC